MVPPSPIGFERSAIAGTTLDDLDLEALDEHLRGRAPSLAEGAPLEQLACSFGLLSGSGGRYVPTAAGLLTFGRFPQLTRPEWGIAAVRISGLEIAAPIAARSDLEGGLRAMLATALAFIDEHARSLDGLTEPEYPGEAVREAIVNALVHRDYRLTSRVAVRIFDDRLEVWSPGNVIAGLGVEDLVGRGGLSFARNPILTATARGLGLVDQIGRGLPLIRRATEQHCGRPPKIAADPAGVQVTIPSRVAAAAPLGRPTN